MVKSNHAHNLIFFLRVPANKNYTVADEFNVVSFNFIWVKMHCSNHVLHSNSLLLCSARLSRAKNIFIVFIKVNIFGKEAVHQLALFRHLAPVPLVRVNR